MFIFTVPQNHCVIIEMFGKPVSVKTSGLNFRIPLVQHAKNVSSTWGDRSNIHGCYISLAEQLIQTNSRQYTTKDNVNVTADCIIRWRISDAIKAVYSVERLHDSLRETVLNEIRSQIGNMQLNNVLTGRAEISEKVTLAVTPTLTRWGITLTAVEIQQLTTDDETAAAMRQIVEAERRSRAIAAAAEGESKAKLMMAEAEKQADILRAEGASAALRLRAEAEAEYLKQLIALVGEENAAKVLMNRQTLEGYGAITSSPASKVYLPSNMPSAVMDVK